MRKTRAFWTKAAGPPEVRVSARRRCRAASSNCEADLVVTMMGRVHAEQVRDQVASEGHSSGILELIYEHNVGRQRSKIYLLSGTSKVTSSTPYAVDFVDSDCLPVHAGYRDGNGLFCKIIS